MNNQSLRGLRRRAAPRGPAAFTLIEVLTVLAVLAMLIGLLLPALQSARVKTRTTTTRNVLKVIEDGLELFRGENGTDRAFRTTGGYPPSAAGDDPTEPGTADTLFGAHWLVRHLLGKDIDGFHGFVPRRFVPRELRDPGSVTVGYEQEGWYEPEAFNGKPLDRVGPYVPLDSEMIIATEKLPGAIADAEPNLGQTPQPVLVGSFGNPILYYAASAMQAMKPHAPLATFDHNTAGIYNHGDNGMFTGQCMGTEGSSDCAYQGWNFGMGKHPIRYFGPTNPPEPVTIDDDPTTFSYYLLDKQVFETTTLQMGDVNNATMVPHRKTSYLLITAGRDGLFGTSDDVKNY